MYAAWLSTRGTGSVSVEVTAETLGSMASEAAVLDPDSPLRDAIFLRFARGEEPSDIELEAPDAVVQAVRSRVHRWEWRIRTAAFVLSGLIMLAGIAIKTSGIDLSWAPWKDGTTAEYICLTLFFLPNTLGPIFGVLHAWRGWSDRVGRFGVIPLVASCIAMFFVSGKWLTDPPAITGLWVVGGVVPCLSMALVPGRQVNWRRFRRSMISGAREAAVLPGVLAVAVGLYVIMNHPYSGPTVVAPFTITVALAFGLHGAGVGILFARWTNLPMAPLIGQAAAASWFGYPVGASIVFLASVGFHSGVSPPGRLVTSIVVAVGLVSPYLACPLEMNAKSGVPLGPSMLIWLFAAAALSAVIAIGPSTSPFIGLLPLLPTAVLLLSVAATRPWELRELQVWYAVGVFAICSYLIGIVSTRFLIESCCVPTAIGSAAWLVEFIPLPAAFAYLAGLRSGTSVLEAARQSLGACYPSPATRWIAVLWCVALAPILGVPEVDLSPAYLPLAVGTSLELGPSAFAVLLWGGLPMLIGIGGSPFFGGFHLEPALPQPHPDLVIVSIGVHWLITNTRKRDALAFLKQIDLLQASSLMLLGGVSIRLTLSDGIILGGDVALPVGLMLALAGAMGARSTTVLLAIAFAAVLDVSAYALPRSVAMGSLAFDYQVNFLTLPLLYMLGRFWMRAFTADKRVSEIRLTVYSVAVALLITDLVFSVRHLPPLPASSAASVAASIAFGSLQSYRKLPALLVQALALFVVPILPYVLYSGNLLQFAGAGMLMFGGVLMGSRLGTWALGDGAEWLRRQIPPTPLTQIGGALPPENEPAKPTSELSSAPSEPEQIVGAEDTVKFVELASVRQQVDALAAEYERVRGSMPSSDVRTRAMEAVVSKMRAIGGTAYLLRHELSLSPSPGHRLQAIVSLQIIPDYGDLLDWLADRIGTERPFVGYHALVALNSAAGNESAPEHLVALERTLDRVRNTSSKIDRDTDRRRMVDRFERQIERLQKMSLADRSSPNGAAPA
jgi:hypothetical protein